MLDAKLSITSTGMLDAFRAAEIKAVMKQVENLKSIGCDILVVKEGIDDEARQALADAGILAYRRVENSDLELLARACSTSLIHDIGRATKDDLGAFISTREELKGGTNHWILESEDDAATLIARGSSNEILGEVERCFADALGVACQLQEDPKLLPGGGATQVALARAIRRHAETIPSREQMAMEAWADGLEVIPRALAENAGLDPIESLLKLTAAQSEGGVMIGLDLDTGIPSDTVSRGVLEPVKITRQAISGATEAAISILRIDDVLWAQMDAQVPDDIQQQLAGMGPE
jgi:chaperonin GroEL (HSP60 family)